MLAFDQLGFRSLGVMVIFSDSWTKLKCRMHSIAEVTQRMMPSGCAGVDLLRILEAPELVCCSSRAPACGIRIFCPWQRNTGFDPTFQSLAVHLRRVKSQEDVLELNDTPWTTHRLLSFVFFIVHTRAVRGAKGIKLFQNTSDIPKLSAASLTASPTMPCSRRSG